MRPVAAKTRAPRAAAYALGNDAQNNESVMCGK
jgi:hypothetical protein